MDECILKVEVAGDLIKIYLDSRKDKLYKVIWERLKRKLNYDVCMRANREGIVIEVRGHYPAEVMEILRQGQV
jgi:hypothetical protein